MGIYSEQFATHPARCLSCVTQTALFGGSLEQNHYLCIDTNTSKVDS